eukprot:Sro75_g041040.2  (786) ;mRNA; r:27365-29722
MDHLLQPQQHTNNSSNSNNTSSSSQQRKHNHNNHSTQQQLATAKNSANNYNKRGNKRKLVHHQDVVATGTSKGGAGAGGDKDGDVELKQVSEQLQQWSQPILQSILQEYVNSNTTTTTRTSSLDASSSIQNSVPTFKVKPPQGKKKKQQQDQEPNSNLTLCTTICAAIAGKSKGAIDRDGLSERLAQQFKETHAGKSIATTTSTSVAWKLVDVQRHAKSGQVFCTLARQQVTPSSSEQQPNNSNNNNHNTNNGNHSSDDASMKDAASTTGGPNTTTMARDKLQEWMDEHGSTMADFSSASHPTDFSQLTPYSFAVHTVPAHESALDPQVHKLYFLYQTKVHQDADPFTCDLNKPNNNNSNSNNLNNSNSSMTGNTNTDDANGMEDDEWSTPATSDGNNVYQQPNGGKLSPPPPPLPPSNSNDAARNPPGFVDTAKRMLQREYSHVPRDRLKQITKSYGSFYQFLVESPFTIPAGGRPRATVTETPPSSANNNTKNSQHIQLPSGTYHQQYRVAGMLIAVGVVDLLPHGLSSVYLFYHPQFARDLVPLGKYAILQEIEFARALQLPYYYLGYYIESCTKMRYKAEYRPSELLCPTTYKWVDAMLAQRIIQTYSPVQHCCTLYYEDQEQLELDLQRHAQQQQQRNKKQTKQENGKHNVHEDDDDGTDDMSMDDPMLVGNHPSPSSSQQGNGFANSSKQASLDNANSTSTAQPSTSTTTTKSILKKPNPSPFPPNPYVEQVKMDVGVGVPVTLSMLHERGRETVRPLLEDFVKEAGPELSQKCLVKFS